MEAKITVLPGDGVGPEIVAEAVKILEAIAKKFGHHFRYIYKDVGGAAIDKHGTPIPKKTIESCQRSDAVLLGAVGGPKWDDLKGEARAEWPVLYMRKEFGLFGNIRPVKLYSPLVNIINLKPELVQH